MPQRLRYLLIAFFLFVFLFFLGIKMNGWKMNETVVASRSLSPRNRDCQIDIFDNYNLRSRFQRRQNPVIRAALMYYGDEAVRVEDLRREYVQVIETRFVYANSNIFQLKITSFLTASLPEENFVSVSSGIFDEGLTYNYSEVSRRWPLVQEGSIKKFWHYYRNTDNCLALEAYGAFRLREPNLFDNFDILIVLTDLPLRHPALRIGRVLLIQRTGFYGWVIRKNANLRRLVVNENPAVIKRTQWFVAEETIHEVGHVLGLNHSCVQDDVVYSRKGQIICSQCCARNDIMSLCRDRSRASVAFVHRFSNCALRFIRRNSLPTVMVGGIPPRQIDICQ